MIRYFLLYNISTSEWKKYVCLGSLTGYPPTICERAYLITTAFRLSYYQVAIAALFQVLVATQT